MKNPIDTLLDYMELPNIAEKLKQDDQVRIGQLTKRGFETDDTSRTEWKKTTEEGIKIAEQVKDVGSRYFASMVLVHCLIEEGKFESAEALVGEAYQKFYEIENWYFLEFE